MQRLLIDFQASLGYIDNPDHAVSFKCGGTLISNFFVLTADNCIRTQVPVVVRLGKVIYAAL